MRYTIILLALLALAGGVYYWQSLLKNELAAAPPAENPEKTTAADSVNHYPVSSATSPDEKEGASAGSKTPTGIDDSDASLEQSLSDIFGIDRFANLINREDILRHFVVTTENAESPKLPAQFSPFKPVGGSFLATTEGKNHFLSSANYSRYAPYVELLSTTDLKRLVNLYSRFYTLIQAAYQDLGTKDYFNDKLVQVIDHMLKTPEITQPVQLIAMSVNYKYSDPKLEALSASQKILIRMGPANARVVKGKLHELRDLVTHLGN